MGRMERTIFCFAVVAALLVIVLVRVARVPIPRRASSDLISARH